MGHASMAATTTTKATTKGHYCTYVVALVAVAGAYIYFDRTSTLNRFGVAVTETLCDMLPVKTSSSTPVSRHFVTTAQ